MADPNVQYGPFGSQENKTTYRNFITQYKLTPFTDEQFLELMIEQMVPVGYTEEETTNMFNSIRKRTLAEQAQNKLNHEKPRSIDYHSKKYQMDNTQPLKADFDDKINWKPPEKKKVNSTNNIQNNSNLQGSDTHEILQELTTIKLMIARLYEALDIDEIYQYRLNKEKSK